MVVTAILILSVLAVDATIAATIRLASLLPFSYYEADGNSVNKSILMAVDDINVNWLGGRGRGEGGQGGSQGCGDAKSVRPYSMIKLAVHLQRQNLIPGANFTIDLFDTNNTIAAAITDGFAVGKAGYSGVIGEDNSVKTDTPSLFSYHPADLPMLGVKHRSSIKRQRLVRQLLPRMPDGQQPGLRYAQLHDQPKLWSIADAFQAAATSYGVKVLIRSNYDVTESEALGTKLVNTKASGARIIIFTGRLLFGSMGGGLRQGSKD
ncbi:hypothetical protein BDK51DRAFT_41082 [Blyttiomyces helicus]|uniref:Periplasmic binding protein-like I n=1 Tax=Blyttiomyces helicus TaxID=388810 RepID=A0A4P9WI90_9FUNG|nr:hypothetical protein BDK51DRAFT_41082 [Blyttiomyces helicus]|eukprot:RKO92484.1 hypothetical protein BDK51DRAFT_41082 [Blyttiomyces helicus]